MPIVDGKGETTARLFVASYTLKDKDPATRPVTFLFNGGPGAASAFLHLGVVGPRVLVTNPDGTLPRPPATLMDNPETWLAFTDLVFVDPVGTGYSRATGKDDDAEKRFWGVKGDVSSLSEIVRLWLTQERALGLAQVSGGGELWRLPRRDDGARSPAECRDRAERHGSGLAGAGVLPAAGRRS